MEIGEADTQQGHVGCVLPRHDKGSRVAHTWLALLSSPDENELSCFTGDFIISLFPEKNLKAKKVPIKVYAV